MPGEAKEIESVYVGIGSNLDEPLIQVAKAVDALAAIPDTRVVQVSSRYLSAPFGPVEQPDFVNAVAQLATDLDVADLFRCLQEIEQHQGRVRGERWGPRVIDLDLLAFGTAVIATDELTVPHPGIAERNFVLLPLQEIAPDLDVPGLGRIADLAADRNEPRITRLD